MIRFLPLLVIVLLIAAFGMYLPIKREIVYKLGLSGDSTTACCNIDQLSKTGNFDESASVAFFDNQFVDYPKTSLAQANKNNPIQDVRILGTTNAAGEEKWIEVSLNDQKLRAWEGNRLVMEFPISSGKWAPTPTGDFRVWYKTRFQSMVGGRKELGTYYNLPNVPNNMFFYQGYAIHGAYWHNNFGHPMSHGCVNEPLANSTEIFAWAGPVLPDGQNAVRATPENPGTRVSVH